MIEVVDLVTMDISGSNKTGYDEGNFCFDPNTLVQMADGSEN